MFQRRKLTSIVGKSAKSGLKKGVQELTATQKAREEFQRQTSLDEENRRDLDEKMDTIIRAASFDGAAGKEAEEDMEEEDKGKKKKKKKQKPPKNRVEL